MKKHYPDLYQSDRSVTSRFMNLLKPQYHKETLPSLKELAMDILNDPTTHVSDHKKKEYQMNIEKMKSISQFQFYLTNIAMNGSNLSLK